MQFSPATTQKRQQLEAYIERIVKPIPSVIGLVGIGSIALGTARPDSDIDLVALLDPFDQYALPAEAIWRPSDNTYHSIFREVEGLQLDIARMDCTQHTMPEGQRAELSTGWLAYDRDGRAQTILAQWTDYPDQLRIERIDEAIIWLDQHLGEDTPLVRWETLGALVAHDRLNAAYSYIVQALFALNRRWQPWRNREIDALIRLLLLPNQFEERVLLAACTPSLDTSGYQQRVETLRSLMADIITLSVAEGIYHIDALDESFIRHNEEPGRAWNIAEWSEQHRQRYGAGS